MAGTGKGKVSRDSRSLNLIRSWDDCPIVAPEVLREWLSEEVARCESEKREIMEQIESIRAGDNSDKLQALSLLENGDSFVRMANPAIRNLSDDEHPAISAAFTAGLRLGMTYWNLRRIRSGLLKRVWDVEDRCENLRERRAKVGKVKRRNNRQRAERALKWAREKFPTAAADDKTSFLKNKAAEHLGISRSTLYEWLEEK